MFTLQSEPQNKYALIEHSITLYRQSISAALPYTLTGALFATLPLLLGVTSLSRTHPILFWTMTSICLVLMLISYCAYLFRLNFYCHNIKTDSHQTFSVVFSKIPSLIMLGVLYSLILLSATMLLIIPGVILAISFVFSFVLLITTNQSVFQTLISSHRLVWGHWWHSFLVILFPLLFNTVIALTVFVLLLGSSAMFKLSLPYLNLLAFISTVIVQGAIAPFLFCTLLVLLHDLRQRQPARPPWQQ